MSEITDSILSSSTIHILENMHGGLAVFRPDESRELLYVNKELCYDFGVKSRTELLEICHYNVRSLIHPDDRERIDSVIHDLTLHPDTAAESSFRSPAANGRQRMFRASCRLMHDRKAGSVCITSLTDFGMLYTPDQNPYKDELTGLLSAWRFFGLMDSFRRANILNEPARHPAVLFMDIKNFHLVNTAHGRAAGDDFLYETGKILLKHFPDSAVSRFDADHFGILTRDDELEKRAGKARMAIQDLYPDLALNISFGALYLDNYAVLPEAACSYAKTACDENDSHPAVFFSYYTPDLERKVRNEEYVITHIDEAIQNGWIQVYYQPVIRSLSGQVCGFEALARWIDPKRGRLNPGDFIPYLESSQQIAKLDLCVIRQVCQHHAERRAAHEAQIPCSVNLSRIDFAVCDIFTEIEKILRTYDIPRRLIRIEVTESALSNDMGRIRDSLNRFRNAGYDIWMDDFGSAYSTLNVLKDYPFDLIKIDMAFLKKETPRSRSIISSIIAMARRIGSHTLAEGVETREQFEFLRQQGCEIVQGYYFGKPMPAGEAINQCISHGIGIEEPQWVSYYNAVSKIDFQTDMPTALAEYDGRFHILFINPPFLRLLSSSWHKNPAAIEARLNDPSSASYQEFRKAAVYAIRTGRPGVYFTEEDNTEFRLKYEVLSRCEDRSLFAAWLTNVTRDAYKENKRERLLRNLRYFYDDLFAIDLSDMTLQPIMETGETESEGLVRFRDSREAYYASLPEVFAGDSEAFTAFLNPDDMAERIHASHSAVIRGCFRTRSVDGSFAWKAHRLMLIPGSHDTLFLYGVRTIDPAFFQADMRDMQKDPFLSDFEDTRSEKEALFDDLAQNSPIPFFWKDRERRFLGASRSFLEYYGYDDISPILGRTDDEVGWHPKDEPYRTDENEVMDKEELHLLVPGRCIAKGIAHNILATKWPVYRNGRTAGLMGFFLDENMIARASDIREKTSFLDPQTNAENVQGILGDFSNYLEEFRLYQRPFAVILLSIPAVTRETASFGSTHGNAILKACADAMRTVIGNRGSIGRIGAQQFVILMKYGNPDEVISLAEILRDAVESIHSVRGEPCTLFAKSRILYASNDRSFLRELIDAIQDGSGAETDSVSLIEGSASPIMRSFFEEMPFGVAILRRDGRIDFWSSHAEEITGWRSEQIVGQRCDETPLRVYSRDGTLLCGTDCPLKKAMRRGVTAVKHTMFKCADGRMLAIRSTIAPLRNKDGTIQRTVWFLVPEAPEESV